MRDVRYLSYILLVAITLTYCEPGLAMNLKEKIQNVQKQLQAGAEKAAQAIKNAKDAAQAERQKELDALIQSKTQADAAAQAGNYTLAIELLRGAIRGQILTGRNPVLADCYDNLSAYEKLQADAELKKHFSPIPLSCYPFVIYGGLVCFALCWAPILIAQLVNGALGLLSANNVFNWMSSKTFTLASLAVGLIGLGCSYAAWGIYQPLDPIQRLFRDSNSDALKAAEIRSNTSQLEVAPKPSSVKERQKVKVDKFHAERGKSDVKSEDETKSETEAKSESKYKSESEPEPEPEPETKSESASETVPTEKETRRKHWWTLSRLKHDHIDKENGASSDNQLQPHHKWWHHADK